MKDIRTILIILLAAILMATWGFYIYDKSQATEQTKNTLITDSTEFKKAVLQAVEDSLKKAYAVLKPDTVFISKDSLLNQQSISEDSISNKPISENEKDAKSEKPKISKAYIYFNASGVNLSAITTRVGNKPLVTNNARESEKIILSFTLYNKLLPTSEYNVYVVITQPDQKVIRSSLTGKDYFYAGKDGYKPFTQKIHFTYIHKSNKTLTSIVKPVSFAAGNYTVKIYHDGKMIGTTTMRLQ